MLLMVAITEVTQLESQTFSQQYIRDPPKTFIGSGIT